MSKSLSEQVAALEAERDAAIKRADYLLDENKAWREKGMSELKLRLEAESRLATAQVEGARKVASEVMDAWRRADDDASAQLAMQAVALGYLKAAPPRASEGERVWECKFEPSCAKHCTDCRPTPQAAPDAELTDEELTDEELVRVFDILESLASSKPVSAERLARIREGVLRQRFGTTEAAPEREAGIELRLRTRSEEILTEDGYRNRGYAAIVITPADARRIVQMGGGA